MKIPQKSKEKKDKMKKKEMKKKDQVLTIAQEIKFARLLSGNDKKSRDKVLKTLKKWLLSGFEKKDVGPHSSFTMLKCKEDDFIRIWKGLFYGVWLSDKPLVQEDLCENIAGILDLFPLEYLRHAFLMYKAGLRVLATQWYGIDHHRMDKFLMLVRRCLRASLRCLLRTNWDLDSCRLYSEMIGGDDGILSVKTPPYARNATSMILHFLDCYLEEISKVSGGRVPGAGLAALLRPVCALVGGEQRALAAAGRRVLTALVRQSDLGLRYEHRARAWQKMGCPEGGPDALELVSDDDEEHEEMDQSEVEDLNDDRPPALDPRAGRVCVELRPLKVPAALLADELRALLAGAGGAAHTRLRVCLQRFEQLARAQYPLRVAGAAHAAPAPPARPAHAARSLRQLEDTLVSESDELALRGLSRKHRKRLLAKSRSGLSIVEDVESVRQKISNATVGKWQVDPTEPEQEKSKQERADNENKKRKNDTREATDHKRRKADKVNGDVTDKRIKSDKKNYKNVVNKMSAGGNSNKSNQLKNKIIKTDNSDKLCAHKHDIERNKINLHKLSVNKNHEINKGIKKKKISKMNVIQHKLVKKNKINLNDIETLSRGADVGGPVGSALQSEKISKKKKNGIDKQTKNGMRNTILVNKVKHFQKQSVKPALSSNKALDTPKKVKFVLKNNSMQAPIDYYKSIRQSPNIPFDGTKQPTKTNLKPSTPSPINPFFKKKLKLKC